MSHTAGALALPAPATGSDEPVTDPALAVLGDFFRALLEKYLTTAWEQVAPGEPIVAHLSAGHDPEEMDLSSSRLPTLALWREVDGSPTHLADGHAESQTTIHVLWILPPATQEKSSLRYPFFSGFDKVMQLAVANERDPAYQHADDVSFGATAIVKAAAEAYGSNVMRVAGIDWWRLLRVQRAPVSVPGANMEFMGYLATWIIAESTVTDPQAFVGTAATSIRFDLTDQSGENALVRQSALIPPNP